MKKVKVKKRNYTKQAKKMQKELLWSILSMVVFVFLLMQFHQSPELYTVVNIKEDSSYEIMQYYSDFSVAKQHYDKMILRNQGFNPAILDEEGKIRAIRYGFVNFRTKSCDTNTSYTIEHNDQEGYINGCYGADGAFLDINDSGTAIRFKQSGVIGWVSSEEVTIKNYFNHARYASHSYYSLEDNTLMHHISNDIQDVKQSTVSIGEPNFTMEGNTFYSYDGHYFYQDYTKMIDDYRNDTNAQSINAKTPYYNYFQYVSHRGKTSYITNDIDWYITNYLGYASKPTTFPPQAYESQLVEEGYSFIKAQNQYGTNAMMMLALAINESAYGRSQIAIEKNNLFGHAAYDFSPKENASGYTDVNASIEAHSYLFLHQGYLNPCDGVEDTSRATYTTCHNSENRYKGGFFGDKASGLNVKYASDPYWGEKAAALYRTMDRILGEKDKDKYEIKVLEHTKNIEIYAQPDTESPVLFMTPDVYSYAFIVLEEVEGDAVEENTKWYKIQSDATLNDTGTKLILDPQVYSATTDVGYIPAAYVK